MPCQSQEKPMPTTVSPRILIVDDEVEITEILADLLSEEYECLRAASAEEALAHLHGSQFQLVISDITLPGMRGLDMIPRVKALSPDTVVVMISKDFGYFDFVVNYQNPGRHSCRH